MRRPVLALASGVALTLAFPGYDLWWLAPIGIGLLALATYAAGLRRGLALGVLAGLAHFVPTLSWAGTDFLGVVPWLGLATSQALYVGVVGGLAGWLQRRRIRPMVVASAWVALEALRARTPYGGFPWARLAFSQADSPLGQLAAVGGAPAVGFATALAGALLAVAAHAAYRTANSADAADRRGPAHRPVVREGGPGVPGAPRSTGRVPAWTAGVVSPAVVALGVLEAGLLVPLPTDGTGARVLAVQGNVPRPGLDFNAERRAVLDLHVTGTIRAVQAAQAQGRRPVDLVVWPENASDIDPTRNPDAQEQIQRAVEAAQAPLLLGSLLNEPAPKFSNVTLMYLPGRGLVQSYVKQHPVPFAEYIPDRGFFRRISGAVDLLPQDMAAGDRPGIFRVPVSVPASVPVSGPVPGSVNAQDSSPDAPTEIAAGVSICFEIAYDDLVLANVEQGANLLVVQTNNATFGRSHESVQQLAISRIRAMEHGRAIVHVSTVGVSALIRPDGTLVAPTALFTAAALEDELPLRTGRTLATRLGPWPEYLAVLLLLALVVAALVDAGPVGRRRKERLPG